MVDRLKKSLEHLEPPNCSHCLAEMNWFESRLVAPEPSLIIEHFFVCDTCGRTQKRQQNVESKSQGGVTKLSRSRDLARVAFKNAATATASHF
jgi:hypothetical protein